MCDEIFITPETKNKHLMCEEQVHEWDENKPPQMIKIIYVRTLQFSSPIYNNNNNNNQSNL